MRFTCFRCAAPTAICDLRSAASFAFAFAVGLPRSLRSEVLYVRSLSHHKIQCYHSNRNVMTLIYLPYLLLLKTVRTSSLSSCRATKTEVMQHVCRIRHMVHHQMIYVRTCHTTLLCTAHAQFDTSRAATQYTASDITLCFRNPGFPIDFVHVQRTWADLHC